MASPGAVACGVWFVSAQAEARLSAARACANAPCRGQAEAMATLTRRTLIRDYAAAIAAQDGLAEAPPVEKLVPIIVERFITTDRAFQAPVHRAPPAVPREPPPHSEQSPSTRERQEDQPTIAGSE